MKSKVVVRYVSGREEEFEIELAIGTSSADRLKAFAMNPTVLLQTDNEVIIIPATAVERITFSLPESEDIEIALPNVIKGKRLE